jgi:hypothetical protein
MVTDKAGRIFEDRRKKNVKVEEERRAENKTKKQEKTK